MSAERIGKYRVLAKLGQGGMARVLLTMSQGPHGFNKLLVVKELREELAHDPDFLAMFLDEARIAARLNHPNIVQTYEVGSDVDRYFIAMEYLEGQPLNAVFRRVGRKNIPLEIHLRILADVLAGLEHAHNLADFDGTAFHVVHRDVSPQNVFVTYEGAVKLVDFGIAKAAGASSRTQEGMLKGKISYIAPEQARCEPVDARADLFTVGVMLWEAMAGRRMITREDEMSVLARRMAGQDPSIRTVVNDVPDELAAICDKAMAPKREDRYQTAREFQEVIERYLSGSDFRVGPKDVASVVSSAFEDERARIRATIEEQVRNVDHLREPISLELVPASLKATSDSLARVVLPVRHGDETFPNSPQTAISQAVPPAQTKGRSLLSALGVGTALALCALGIVLYVNRRETSSNSGGPATAAAAPEKTTTSGANDARTAAGSTTTDATPARETIKVVVKYPEDAKAKLDGGYVEGNPFTATLPKDGSIHKLEVELAGHKTDKRTLTFDRDIDLDVELTPLPGRPYIRPTKPPPAETASAVKPPPPVDDGKKKPQPSVDIDETNPYKKKQ
ncbi:MAG: protein kinase [Polyangiaceae bacterium]|nr:protein kinase [Polyangiaceae bacterium]